MAAKYKFDDYEFDSERFALYRNSEIVKVEKKALEVLAVIIERPHKLVTSQEIIERVWADNPHGVTSTHLAQSISKLRKAFSSAYPENEYVETIKGCGYSFRADVTFKQPTEPAIEKTDSTGVRQDFGTLFASPRQLSSIGTVGLAVVCIAVLAILGFTAFDFSPGDDEQAVRDLIEESQKYESMVMYRDPRNLDEDRIKDYWVTDADPGAELDIVRIRAGIDRLNREEKYYGPESKLEQMEFQFVEINSERDFATVKTLERWFLAEYHQDGTLVKNKTVGPYFVHYIVRKFDGKWRIERSSTARVTPPTPTIDAVEFQTPPQSGKEFFVRIAGKSFVPDVVQIKLVGPGCPESLPCSVPNSVLRLRSSITDTSLERVPLTLAAGEFTVYAQNNDSSPSNSLTLTVP